MSDLSSMPPSPSEPNPPERAAQEEGLPAGLGVGRPVRWWLVALTIIELLAVTVLQRPSPPDPAHVTEARTAAKVEPPGANPYILLGKMLVGFRGLPDIDELIKPQLDAQPFGPPSAADEVRIAMLLIGTGSARSGRSGPAAPSFPGLPPPPPARSAEQILNDAEKGLAEKSPLKEDIEALRPLAAASDGGGGERAVREQADALPPAVRDGLKKRHGWFADVLFSANEPEAPVRKAAAAQATVFAVLMVAVGGVMILALIAGLVLLIIGIVRVYGGKERSTFAPAQKPVDSQTGLMDAAAARGSGLWLETVAVFLAGFLGLKLMQVVIAAAFGDPPWALWATLLGQWLLLLCIFWPRLRGLGAEDWRKLIGWHAPRGVVREVGAGFCAYIASVPIFFGVAMVMVVLMLLIQAIRAAMGQPPEPPPTNHITEIVGAGGPWVLVVVFLLATVWAPIVEESIFRGALYRTLRGRFAMVGAASISAIVFAVMHGYIAVQLLMVFTLGAVFAVMREWRNSLVPSATAHALHNGFVMTLMLIVGWLMRG